MAEQALGIQDGSVALPLVDYPNVQPTAYELEEEGLEQQHQDAVENERLLLLPCFLAIPHVSLFQQQTDERVQPSAVAAFLVPLFAAAAAAVVVAFVVAGGRRNCVYLLKQNETVRWDALVPSPWTDTRHILETIDVNRTEAFAVVAAERANPYFADDGSMR